MATKVHLAPPQQPPHQLPGDVVVTLREKPQREFRRAGAKDLERVGPAVRRGDVFYIDDFRTPNGARHVLHGPALLGMVAGGKRGGLIGLSLPGEGLLDPEDPWERPPGDLSVSIPYPAVAPEDWTVRVLDGGGPPPPLLLVGAGADAGPGAAAGALAAAGLQHRRLAAELWADCCPLQAGGGGGSMCGPTSAPPPTGVCLRFEIQRRPSAGGARVESSSSCEHAGPRPSAAAAAAMAGCAAAPAALTALSPA